MWFGMTGVVLCKSRDVNIVQDSGGVLNCAQCVQYGRKREWRCRREEWIYIYSSCCDLVDILGFVG